MSMTRRGVVDRSFKGSVLASGFEFSGATLLPIAALLLYSQLAGAQNDGAAGVQDMLEAMTEHASRGPMDARFMATAPGIGEPLPDVVVFDARGNPVDLREMTSRGHYTVLTLGCLT